VIAQLTGQGDSAAERISGGGGDQGFETQQFGDDVTSQYRGAQGLDPEFIAKLEAPVRVRQATARTLPALMMWNYIRFDFGESYFRDVEVIDLIIEKLPVSISLGLWMTLLSYGISIPLGIAKGVSDGSRFDIWTSAVVIVAYAIPGLSVRDPADRAVCRRIVLGPLPAAQA
jgi:microcin C transport system permease protein